MAPALGADVAGGAVEAAGRVTPFWEQYCRLKAQHPDALLWTRMGDFYEMFEDDARVAAHELHITLTSREFGKDFRVALAGVPYHAAESYLARLIRKGFHVAICEQMSEPGRGLVEREVVRVVTPGTLTDPGLLPQRANNYLAALLWDGERGALAYADVSTGEFGLAEFDGAEAAATFDAELRRLAPAECLTPRDQDEPFALPGHRTTRDPWQFDTDSAREQLLLHFHTQSLAAFGCDGLPLATACAGAVLRYLGQTNPATLTLITSVRAYSPAGFMQLDGQTRRNLNLTRGAYGAQDGSLLAVLDATQTACGARLLRRWIGQPLLDRVALLERQELTAALVAEPELRAALRKLLRSVLDVERVTGRLRSGGATPREVWGLGQSLQAAAALRQLGRHCQSDALRLELEDLDPCGDVEERIAAALAEPGSGRTVAPGHSAELDALRAAADADKDWMRDLESRERARTGIKSLKVAVNKVFGYYIEVTNPNRALVPPEYLRKQTVAGAERYLTAELKEVESRLLRAADDLEALEGRLFADLLRRLGAQGDRLSQTAGRLAALDVVAAFAETAARDGWTRPTLDEAPALTIIGGRHPIVERAVGADAFIPNDCRLGGEGPRAMLITGPNMAGKSTYLRQVALITLLAQIGSFVPAESARIGLVDRIFTRVGAHDDLAGGASTFMVEMMETATICRQATARSLIVLDEVGRGTSADDGAAIAQAVLEHLHANVGARTLFATHFRTIGQALAGTPGVETWTFAVLELSGQLAFTHRVAPGVADRSYGLHVARLAGLPEAIVARAQGLLDQKTDGPPAATPARRWCDSESAEGANPYRRRHGVGGGMSLHQHAPAQERPPTAWPLALVPQAPVRGAHTVLAEEADPTPTGDDTPEGNVPLATLLQDLRDLDLAQTTPLQALWKLAEAQQAARRLPGR